MLPSRSLMTTRTTREAEGLEAQGPLTARVFAFYIHDERAPVATLFFMPAADEEGARKYAAARLAETPHRKCVEVWEDETLVFRLSRLDAIF